jgi:AraC-like DNA-binding protein
MLTMRTHLPLHERLDISLQVVATSPYPRLDLSGLVNASWIVSHVVFGSVVTETRGLRFAAGPGDVMVHPPQVPFSERAGGPGVHQWMALTVTRSGEMAPSDVLLQQPVSPVVALGARAEGYRQTFALLDEEWRREPDQRSPLRIAGLTALLLDTVIAAWTDAGAEARPPEIRTPKGRFADLLLYVERHLAERITRDDLARRACLHPGSFDRAFRAAHGDSPIRVLQAMRLARARRLLETTDDTLEHIAAAVGLGDAAHFGRVFRARLGMSPGAYRERAKATTTRYIPPL